MIIHDLSNLLFHGGGENTILENTSHFFQFCDSHNIDCEDVACRLFILTFEAHVKKWCYTLSTTSIHYFKKLVKEMYLDFDMYNYEDVYKNIIHLRMESDESIEYFHD